MCPDWILVLKRAQSAEQGVHAVQMQTFLLIIKTLN